MNKDDANRLVGDFARAVAYHDDDARLAAGDKIVEALVGQTNAQQQEPYGFVVEYKQPVQSIFFRPDAIGAAYLDNAVSVTRVYAEHQVPTQRLQQQCLDWGAYWRASDAHGVDLTHEQALELLRDALGVEVSIKPTRSEPSLATPAELNEIISGVLRLSEGWANTHYMEVAKRVDSAAVLRLTGNAPFDSGVRVAPSDSTPG